MNSADLLSVLGRTSLQAGVLVLAILLVQWAARRHLTARWRAALWLLVVARLLLPISPGSAASLFNLFPRWSSAIPITAPPASVSAVSASPNDSTSARAQFQPFDPSPTVGPSPDAQKSSVSEPGQVLPRAFPPVTVAAPQAMESTPIPWIRIALATWVLGVFLLAGHVLACSLRFSRRCQKLPSLTDPSVLTLLDECALQMRVRQKPRIIECADVLTPALFGVRRPSLLLPKGFLGQYGPQETRFVFLHELAHLQRRDVLLNWIVTWLQIVHWFNPLIWLGFSRWRADRELACDALAIEAAGGHQNREYGRTILHLLENLTPGARGPGLVGILENRGGLRRRIDMIARYRPSKRWGVLSTALVAMLALVTLTDAQTPKPATALDLQRDPTAAATAVRIDALQAVQAQAKSNFVQLATVLTNLMATPREELPQRMLSLGSFPELATLNQLYYNTDLRRQRLNPELDSGHPEVKKVIHTLATLVTLREFIDREVQANLGALQLRLWSASNVIEMLRHEIETERSRPSNAPEQTRETTPKPKPETNPILTIVLIARLEADRSQAKVNVVRLTTLVTNLMATPEDELPPKLIASGNYAELATLNSLYNQTELKRQLQNPDFGPEHPEVRRLILGLAKLKEQIRDEVKANLSALELKLRSEVNAIKFLDQEIKQQRDKLPNSASTHSTKPAI